MKRITVSVDEEIGAAAKEIAEERGISISQFYAEAAAEAVKQYRRQKALQRLDEEVVNTGANVSREEFDAAQEKMRSEDSERR